MNRAITVHQPWAELIALGIKKREFRTKAVPRHLIGRPMYLHAGAYRMRPSDVERILLGDSPAARDLPDAAEPVLRRFLVDPESFDFGALVARISFGEAEQRPEFGRFLGWPILTVTPLLEPIPARGAQGFWTYPRG